MPGSYWPPVEEHELTSHPRFTDDERHAREPEQRAHTEHSGRWLEDLCNPPSSNRQARAYSRDGDQDSFGEGPVLAWAKDLV